jgi:hypothetical protein
MEGPEATNADVDEQIPAGEEVHVGRLIELMKTVNKQFDNKAV